MPPFSDGRTRFNRNSCCSWARGRSAAHAGSEQDDRSSRTRRRIDVGRIRTRAEAGPVRETLQVTQASVAHHYIGTAFFTAILHAGLDAICPERVVGVCRVAHAPVVACRIRRDKATTGRIEHLANKWNAHHRAVIRHALSVRQHVATRDPLCKPRTERRWGSGRAQCRRSAIALAAIWRRTGIGCWSARRARVARPALSRTRGAARSRQPAAPRGDQSPDRHARAPRFLRAPPVNAAHADGATRSVRCSAATARSASHPHVYHDSHLLRGVGESRERLPGVLTSTAPGPEERASARLDKAGWRAALALTQRGSGSSSLHVPTMVGPAWPSTSR